LGATTCPQERIIMASSYFLSTAIPYVNAAPHLGHALEFVQADAFARYRRLRGDDVWLTTGTDDNSLKNVLAAAAEGVTPADLVARNSAVFRQLLAALQVQHDDFVQTSRDVRHAEGARRMWEACAARGDIYRRRYRGLYCVGCEQFYTADDLVQGACPEHERPCEVVEEENWFFRLSRHADALRSRIESGTLRIVPDTRRREVLAFLGRGLEDISISRSRARAQGWGVPVPGDAEQVMYVWFDALTYYISGLGYGRHDVRFQRYWEQAPARVHVIGKGILRFHALYWPAMLLSAGVPLPTVLVVHGYLGIEGRKMSKSLGKAASPLALVDRYGADAVRYWLLAAVPATGDADYSDERLVGRHDAELANGVGNLASRTLRMLHRYRGGRVPPPPPASRSALAAEARTLPGRVCARMDTFDPQGALAAIGQVVTAANGAIDQHQPWRLAREEGASSSAATHLDGVLYEAAESLRLVATALRPFLPDAAERLVAQLGGRFDREWAADLTWGRLRAGTPVAEAPHLFPETRAPP
jgi:methionyl-tRNA synthetase